MAKKKTASKKETPSKPATKQQGNNEEVDLARKYRPQTIEELKGNDTVKSSLTKLAEKDKLSHAILFYGDHGSGKTTLARILAKQLGCSDFDIMEIDTGDFSGVDTSRNIRRKMNTKPMSGPAKAYIVDEAHNLGKGGSNTATNDAQNALLKALEEPPRHAYFFLCTTDPQNLMSTIKSRCTQYKISVVSEKEVFELINEVAEKEGVEIPKKVALQVSRDSLGHPRDALKILEKILWLDEEEMLEASKQEAEKREQSITLSRLMIKANKKTQWKEFADILKGIDEEPERVRIGIRTYFSKVLLDGGNKEGVAAIILDVFKNPIYVSDKKNELVRMVYEAYSELTN